MPARMKLWAKSYNGVQTLGVYFYLNTQVNNGAKIKLGR
jgi:hypothetical protein